MDNTDNSGSSRYEDFLNFFRRLRCRISQHRNDITVWVTVVSALVTAGAAVLTIWALEHAQDTEKQIKNILIETQKTEENIKNILSSLSTKYVGDFSDNMDEINRKLKGAEDSILIISDITAYGCLTAHKKFLDYKQTLINKADSGSIIKIYVYTDGLKKDELLTQLEAPSLKKIKVEAKEGILG